MATTAAVLIENNQSLLRLIGVRRVGSFTEPAEQAGRKVHKLSRKLRAMQTCRLVALA